MEEVEKEEVERLERLIKEDNVDELSILLNSNHNLRNNFNTFQIHQYNIFTFETPLLHFAVRENSQKVVEYLFFLKILLIKAFLIQIVKIFITLFVQ